MARRSVLQPFAAPLQFSGNPAHPAFLHRAASACSLLTNIQHKDEPRLSARSEWYSSCVPDHCSCLQELAVKTSRHPDRCAPELGLGRSLIIIKPLGYLTSDGFNYHTLLLQRNHTNQAFASAHVFPGGHLEQQDHQHQHVLEHAREISTASQTTDAHLQRALKTCAIRETFEESGILVGLSRRELVGQARLRSWREQLVEKKISFGSIFQQQLQEASSTSPNTLIDEPRDGTPKDRIESDVLTHFANFVTPAVLPKRWDTHFYTTILPCSPEQNSRDRGLLSSERHTAIVDGSETVSSVWLTPADAIGRAADGLRLAPPQYYMLADLGRVKDWRELDGRGRGRAVPRLVPEFRKSVSAQRGPTAALILPGDPLHSSSPGAGPSAQTARHRIMVRREAVAGAFCPVGIERVGMEAVFGKGWEDLIEAVEDGSQVD